VFAVTFTAGDASSTGAGVDVGGAAGVGPGATDAGGEGGGAG
jgi:hypothetical protein